MTVAEAEYYLEGSPSGWLLWFPAWLRRRLLRGLRRGRLALGLLEFLRDGVHEAGFLHQHLADGDRALVGILPLALFHGFADGGNRLDAIAGVGAGSVDLV